MKKILALTLTLAMTLSLAACGGSKPAETTAAPAATAAAETTAAAAETTAAPAETAAAAEKGSIQIKYSTWAGDGEAAYEGMKKFKEYIEADSNGVIEVLLYPSDQAGSTNEQVEQVSMNQLQMMSSGDPGVKEIEYLCLPYLEDDVRETVTAYKLMDTRSMYAEQGCYNAFEEEVYALAPEDVTLEKINAIALRSAEAFGTTSEWGAAYDSMSWVDITHFFQQPMYIISYIVSDSMAIQFYEQEVAREGRGLELYKKAMGLAGEKAFTELAPALDLRDPLSAAQVHAIANLLRTQLFK